MSIKRLVDFFGDVPLRTITSERAALYVRLNITSATDVSTINEFQVFR